MHNGTLNARTQEALRFQEDTSAGSVSHAAAVAAGVSAPALEHACLALGLTAQRAALLRDVRTHEAAATKQQVG
jgi:hypothetical protein